MTHAEPNPQQPDDRRAHRKSVGSTEPVINAITGRAMGQIGNISRTGMLLISPDEPVSNAVYQVHLPLREGPDKTWKIEVGVQEQWHEKAASTELYWVGYRIVAISDEDHVKLLEWLELPE